MDQYINSAVDVTSQLFGPDSGVPWWAWLFVLVAVFWKVMIPERQTAADRDNAMAESLLAEAGAGAGGKKGKKAKKK
jgi:hypothetical protein